MNATLENELRQGLSSSKERHNDRALNPEASAGVDHYIIVSITAPREFLDALTDRAAELGTLGSCESGDDPVNLSFYFRPPLHEEAVRSAFLESVPSHASGIIRISLTTETARDWEQEWRRNLHPLRVGRAWLVHTSWQSPAGYPTRIPIVIDPKMAFGTGTHATTRLCLEEFERVRLKGTRVLDVGTGTGILAIAAAKSGAEPVVAVEIDREAIACARENVNLNGTGNTISLREGTIAEVPERGFDLIIANIEYRTLVATGEQLRARIRPNGRAVFSGILQQEADSFVEAMTNAGWKIVRRTRKFDPATGEGWVCCVATPSLPADHKPNRS
ncbi:MAG TPA: 50S ribosomal protein L11 methyltransferase [Candidatus Latescibacteria bacterium]|nr:50S ribosomal protein L11 methyltransferase [Candidatus Latescibacterota bacterium]